MILPSAWWARNLWIDSWWLYDLPIPPFGFQWVRSGPDALLVNTTTGEVLAVRTDIFW